MSCVLARGYMTKFNCEIANSRQVAVFGGSTDHVMNYYSLDYCVILLI